MFADTKVGVETSILTDKHPLTVILLKNMFRSGCCIFFEKKKTFLVKAVQSCFAVGVRQHDEGRCMKSL